MLFNSFTFGYFFLAFYAVYRVLPHRFRNAFLLLASYVFYGYWDWRFLSLIVASTLVDYGCGLALTHERARTRRKAVVAVSVCANLGILGFFKYFDFFVDSLNRLLAAGGLEPAGLRLDIVLPVGISFYTFQTMSYTIDVYRRQVAPTRNLLDFAVYVAFFPQLVAGPIERGSHLLPQVQRRREITSAMMRGGAWLLLVGYFKKTVVADNMAVIADAAFADPGAISASQMLTGVYAFAFQIYGDFSGYSAIARGLALLMGFELMVNFRQPYFATNPSDFWRRWHISLSTWLRDYLYIPLGGNRKGGNRTQVNLMTTMLLGGLWHGAAWNFVAWGAFHGLLLVAHRWAGLFLQRLSSAGRWWRGVRVLVFFHLVCFGWILFRAGSLETIGASLASIGSTTVALPSAQMLLMWCWMVYLILPLLFLDRAQERTGDMLFVKAWGPWQRTGVYVVLFAYILLSGNTKGQEFIYFQF